jgi:aminomethyltransferase
MGKKTSLYNQHVILQGNMVEFAGYDLPIHYGSQLTEHHAVRQTAGIFDVSHMNIVDISGEKSKDFLSYMLANNIGKLSPCKALYSCLLNEKGGVIDDLIVYMIAEKYFRLILNAGTRDKDLEWIRQHAEQPPYKLHLNINQHNDLSIIALQGPKSLEFLSQHIPQPSLNELKPFSFIEVDTNLMIARTGYTGEDGFEIIIHNNNVEELWTALVKAGAHPCGLGARDTLRLEAGYNLYGQDMDESTSPLESNLSWTIAFEPKERAFIGKHALQAFNISYEFVGIMLDKGGILRHGQKIFSENHQELGEITSGGFSPTLNKSIAFVRILKNRPDKCFVNIRDKLLPITLTKPAFVRKGKSL